ncbi:MAG: DUF4199 domain-containing protein [Lewinellaceae bacterium]|nr:DUF4199 domain-containing protein [Lewinellaceae bacterium]
MRKTILTYGFISGAVAAVLMTGSAFYFQQSKDFSNGAFFGYAGILLSMLFVFLGVRAYRDNVSEGRISFGKAFQVGILITMISCVCYVLAWMFVYKNFMPDFLEQYMHQALEQMKQAGATADQIQQESQKMLDYKKCIKTR